jgi:cytochrome c oxidase subunit II
MDYATRWLVQAGAACVFLALLPGCERGEPSLGKRIYADGVGLEGRVAYTQGPEWLRFARSGCAVCHGDRGQGLAVQASGITGVAPAVTWQVLVERGYDETTLRRALVEGIDPQGREFHYYMPRWALTDAELDAMISHLQSL